MSPRARLLPLLPAAVLATLALTAAPALAAPANDSLANAEVLTGTADSASALTTLATYENGEPYLYNGKHSVWYRWTAPSSGAVTIDTAGASYDTALAVYTGATVMSLTQVQNSDDADPDGDTSSRVRFLATPGVTYKIMLNGHQDASGATPVHLALDTTPNAPANDAFAAATALPTGTSANALYDTSLSTTEPQEPVNGSGYSVWFRYTPATTGGVSLQACGDRYRTRTIAVFTGASLATLTPVTSGDNYNFDGILAACPEVKFVGYAGTTYRIALDGRQGDWGLGRLKLSQWTFAPETTISAPPATTPGSTSITFSGTGGTTKQCRLDAGAWAACLSPWKLTGLSSGQHTVAVRSIDGYGWADASPATATWTVDATAPTVAIHSGPTDPITYSTHPSFAFGADEPATLECRYEEMYDYVPCTSPWTIHGTKPGQHLVQVRGKDAMGNVGAPATFAFTSFDPHAKATGPTAGPTTPRTPATTTTYNNGGVRPAGSDAPALHATLGYTRVTRSALLRRHTLTLTVGCAPACAGTVRLALGHKLLTTVRLSHQRAAHRTTVRLSAKALKAIRRQRGRTVVLIAATLRDAGGHTTAPSTGLQLG